MALEQEKQDKGRVGAQGDGQGGRSQVHQAEDATDDGQRHAEHDLALGIAVAVLIEHQAPDGEGQRQDRRHGARHPHAFQDIGVGEALAPRAHPPQASCRADGRQGPGNADRQPRGRKTDIGVGRGQGRRHQDEVEQRDLLGKGRELRAHQFHVVAGDAKQAFQTLQEIVRLDQGSLNSFDRRIPSPYTLTLNNPLRNDDFYQCFPLDSGFGMLLPLTPERQISSGSAGRAPPNPFYILGFQPIRYDGSDAAAYRR
jgi:hypothetical protein